MGKIIILDENTSNQIAAGEVIERPASVLKELIENSIDAGSTKIEVEIRKGGITFIKISDNGEGIDSSDVLNAFERHGTSKIKCPEDLNRISTMGFRGEALASIASVSKVTLLTKTEHEENATMLKIEGGEYIEKREDSRKTGTTFIISDLFYNTPARYKFLKNDSSEGRYCYDLVSRLALSRPDISFKFISNNEELLNTPGDKSLLSSIYAVLGRETAKDIIEVNHSDDYMDIKGYIGKPSLARGNRQHQILFLNNRYIKSNEVSKACEQAYETHLMKGRFPLYILNIYILSSRVDVNVHPAKTQVRFENETKVFNSVYHCVKSALESNNRIEKPSIKPVYGNFSYPEKTHETLKSGGERVKEALKEYVYEKKPEIIRQPMVFEETNEKEKDEWGSYTISGQLFNTYIMLEREKDILVVDQHAAHERITYEKLIREYEDRCIAGQLLLIPMELEFTSSEIDLIEEKKEFINELGFEFDIFGKRSVIIRSVPQQLGEDNVIEAFKGVVDQLAGNRFTDKYQIAKKAIYSMACKNSIKANKKLDMREITELIDRLKNLNSPFSCPHGRPVVLKLEKNDFEKMFKRVK